MVLINDEDLGHLGEEHLDEVLALDRLDVVVPDEGLVQLLEELDGELAHILEDEELEQARVLVDEELGPDVSVASGVVTVLDILAE